MTSREEARKLQHEYVCELEKRLLHAAEVLDKPEMTAEDANALATVTMVFVELQKFPHWLKEASSNET